MELESRIQALIAVGAAMSANGQPCLQATVGMALENGANDREIAKAIEVGKGVRKGVASKIDKFASELMTALPSPSPIAEANDKCECSHP